ncbi:protein translocase subunit secA [Mycolicibacterium chubuense NBB4]|uniref:Protein translocase subunit SecA n=1 Tax=Mycolicibacterium chubuense (strain NBB4) TaxID=710421 RepID=I4BFE5_MYCCN|nr:protein translocase subunit secA [Mycolicibacterium chubuense NBB4]
MLTDLLRLGEGRMVKRLREIAGHIDSWGDAVGELSDAGLRAKTDEFRRRIADGAHLDDLVPEAFAVAREAAWRVLDLRPYDVQVMGGVALHFGHIAEMMTGEGKTLACVLPAYLNGVGGKGVHVITVNDYLARRDAEQMGRVHRFLGLTVGVIVSGMTPDQRRVAYHADITYGTNNEFGFDYLRDNMAHSRAELVQRGHNFAIVDEVDSILIDEARTPLIISGPADDASAWYAEFARLAAVMERDVHYEVDERKRVIGIEQAGVAFVEDQLGLDNLYEIANSALVGYLTNAIRAKELFGCDKDYIVNDDGEVLIVDEFTGRVLVGRRYNEGLHQAIEAKEGVEVKPENQTLATITLQNYFRLYDNLAGMTGTAQTEASEFQEIYGLGVITIPPNRPMKRCDRPDVIYKTERAKFDAVVEDVSKRYAAGQPVLIGTTSVEKSEYLSRCFTELGIPHTVLNAKHLEQEAAIVAEGGRRGAVTVATDMAGRGTDIVLGGNVDFLTDKCLRAKGLDPVATSEDYERGWREERPRIKAAAAAEAQEVVALGGLCVLGTERHESRRIDNQLRGRSGRQGDPGETRFYLSLGDELMLRFNGEGVEKLLTKLHVPDDMPIEAAIVAREIKGAQAQVELQNFEQRRNVLKYDEVMDQQRQVIYATRRRILAGEDLRDQVLQLIRDVVCAYVEGATGERSARKWDLDALWRALGALYPVGIDRNFAVQPTRKVLQRALIADAERAFAVREAHVDGAGGPGAMRRMERDIILGAIDRRWREHLYEMDYLKEGIGLRAMAQCDPVVEFHSEGYDMFVAMIEALKEECVGAIFRMPVESAPTPPAKSRDTPRRCARPVLVGQESARERR